MKDILSRSEELLEDAPEIFVSVEKLWKKLREEGVGESLSFEDYRRALEEDERFEFLSGIRKQPGLGTPETAGLDALSSGTFVKLASREITVEDVFAAMAKSLAQMNEAFASAWETRPEGDEEIETHLQEIMDAGERLEQEVKTLIEKETDSTKKDGESS